MKNGNTMATPPDHDQVSFFIEWWQQILSGAIIILTGWFLKTKGAKDQEPIVHLSEQEIERRMEGCKKTILLAIHAELNVRDDKLFRHIEKQDEKMISHIKDILK